MSIYTHPFLNAYRFYSDPKTVPLLPRRLHQEKKQQIYTKTTVSLKAGNHDRAGKLAKQLEDVSERLERTTSQWQSAEQSYKELTKLREMSVTAAKQRIQSISSDISEIKTQKALAEITETAAGMISELGGAGDSLNRLETIVSDEKNKFTGRSRVALESMGMENIQEQIKEEKFLEEKALAQFTLAEGIELGSIPKAIESR